MSHPYGEHRSVEKKEEAMTKRSALTIAAGLAIALLVGVTAMSLMLGGDSVATAGAQHKPVVKRQVHTVTVHRKAQTNGSPSVRVVHLGSGSTATSSMNGSFADDGFESEGSESSSDDGVFPTSSSAPLQGNIGDD
jgi:hypothetical protein